MNRIQLFINALRSGEFQQGRQRLHRDNTFCCLGVACELYRRETGKGEWVHNSHMDCEGMRFKHLPNDLDAISFMPQPVYAWFGFPFADPLLNTGGGNFIYTASEMNDKLNRNFHEIADAFERTFLNAETK